MGTCDIGAPSLQRGDPDFFALTLPPGASLRAEIIEGDGETIFRHACKLGLEGIVSKRKDSPYRSGRSPDWLKMKNPEAPAGGAMREIG